MGAAASTSTRTPLPDDEKAYACFTLLPRPSMALGHMHLNHNPRVPILTASSCDTIVFFDMEDEEKEEQEDEHEDEQEHDRNDENEPQEGQEMSSDETTTTVAETTSSNSIIGCYPLPSPQQQQQPKHPTQLPSMERSISFASSSMRSNASLNSRSISSSKPSLRLFDVYETDSTILGDDDDDLALLLSSSSSPSPSLNYNNNNSTTSSPGPGPGILPFRKCSRVRCYCCSTNTTSNSTSTSQKKPQHSHPQHSHPHPRAPSPSQILSSSPLQSSSWRSSSSTTTKNHHRHAHQAAAVASPTSLALPSLPLPIKIKSSPSQSLPSQSSPSQSSPPPPPPPPRDNNRQDASPPRKNKSHRKQLSNDADLVGLWILPLSKLQLQLQHQDSDASDMSCNTTATNATANSSSPVVVAAAALAADTTASTTRRRQRAVSQDSFPPSANLLPTSRWETMTKRSQSDRTLTMQEPTPSAAAALRAVLPPPPPAHHKQRSRSEDVIDWQTAAAAAAAMTEAGGVAQVQSSPNSPMLPTLPPSTSSSSNNNNKNQHHHLRPRSHSQHRSTTIISSSLLSNNNIKKPKMPDSPTSVLQVHRHHAMVGPSGSTTITTATATTSTVPIVQPATPQQPPQPQTPSHWDVALQQYRKAIDQLKRQRLPTSGSSNSNKNANIEQKLQIAQLYHNMAWIYLQQSKYSGALCVLQHALELVQLSHGCLTLRDLLPTLKMASSSTNHNNTSTGTSTSTSSAIAVVAHLLMTQARIYQSLGTIKQAKKTIKTALRLLQPLLTATTTTNTTEAPSSSSHTQHHYYYVLFAKALVILAQTYEQDKPDEAMKQYQQALAMLRYSLGNHHTLVAETMLHIGDLHTSQTFYDLAKDAYFEAFGIFQWHGPTAIVDVATTLGCLGWIHLQEPNELDLALQASMDALRMLQHVFAGPTITTTAHPQAQQQQRHSHPHRNIASLEYQIGLIWCRKGHFDRALQMWKQTLAHQRAILKDDNHVDIGLTLESIGIAYQELGRWNKALAFMKSALEGKKHHQHRQRTVPSARLYVRLAAVMMELKQEKGAKRALDKAQKIFKSHQMPLDDMGHRVQQALLLFAGTSQCSVK